MITHGLYDVTAMPKNLVLAHRSTLHLRDGGEGMAKYGAYGVTYVQAEHHYGLGEGLGRTMGSCE